MLTRRFVWIVLVAAPLLGGCRGKLLATAHLTRPGTAEVHFRGGKAVKLWANYAGSWAGPPDSKLPLRFDIEVVQNKKTVGFVTCATDVGGGTSICGTSSDVFGEHTADCEVSMPCSLPKLGPGEVTLKVKGSYADPGRVRRVTLMDLNVRDG